MAAWSGGRVQKEEGVARGSSSIGSCELVAWLSSSVEAPWVGLLIRRMVSLDLFFAAGAVEGLVLWLLDVSSTDSERWLAAWGPEVPGSEASISHTGRPLAVGRGCESART
eukprot:scaffold673760_cov39-Prasinocladus_malaysianus.AAC.1